MKGTCKVCGKTIVGRLGKMYCSAYCKNVYHKNIRYITKQAAIQINGYLKRNYAILLELLGERHTQIKVHRNVLAQKNFRFKYHTHTHINSRNKTYHYVYDLAWMEFSDDEILILRKR